MVPSKSDFFVSEQAPADFHCIDASRIDELRSGHPSKSETELFLKQYFEVVHEVFPILDRDYCDSLLQWFWSPDGWKRVEDRKITHHYSALAIIHCIVATAARYTGLRSYENCFYLAFWELSRETETLGLEKLIGQVLVVSSNCP